MTEIGKTPDPELLERFLLGTLPDADQQHVEEFVENSPEAAATLQGMLPLADTLLLAVSDAAHVPETSPQVLELVDTVKRIALADPGRTQLTSPHAGSDEATHDWTQYLGPAETSNELGRLGGYRVLRVLGRGGMGVVFEAEDPQLHRRVALKVVTPAIAKSAAAKARFLREARAAAAVEHDNIIAIYQVGEDRGLPFLAMPLLQGETLADRLKREQRLPSAEVARIGREIAAGLAAAHERGLIHRDIKPANLWLDGRSGRVKILDFGLARDTVALDEPSLTQSGAIVGTPHFMAPEQAEGLEIDARTDLFSLGSVLYCTATGELPFPGNSPLRVLAALANRTPPRADSLVKDLPPDLGELIARLLQKDPADRPASAKDVAQELARFEERQASRRIQSQFEQPTTALEPASTTTLATPAKSRTGFLAAGLALALVAAGLAWPFFPRTPRVESPDAGPSPPIVGASTASTESTSSLEVAATPVMSAPSASLPSAPTVPPPPDGAPPPAVAPFDAAAARAHQEAWAKHLGTTVETTNSQGARLLLIPPGEFLMGSSDEQIAVVMQVAEQVGADQTAKSRIPRAERPQHGVTISQPFWLGATEVTIGEFKQFAAATGFKTDAEKALQTAGGAQANAAAPIRTYLNPGYSVTDDFPVATVTWHDAVAYCEWLSQQEEVKYRLPTEAEWEFACRAGTATLYYFGDDHSVLDRHAWFESNNGRIAHPVATKLPNPFGLYDMYGNVSEWCQDLWQENAYGTTSLIDPTGPTSGIDRVTRGGGMTNASVTRCRSAFRAFDTPAYRPNHNGFRIAREVASLPRTPSRTSAAGANSPANPTTVTTSSSIPSQVGGLKFDGIYGRVEVPLQLPVNTPLTVEFDVTHGEVHPVPEQLFLFQHNKNLDFKIQGDRVVLSTGPWPDVRAHFYKVNVVQPGRRRLIAATVTGEMLQLFVDGQRVEWRNTSRLETDTTLGFVWLGRPYGGGSNHPFDGLIHRVRISTGERYDQSYTPEAEWLPGNNAIVLYDFRTRDPGTEAKDLTGRGNHGKIVSSKWVKGAEPSVSVLPAPMGNIPAVPQRYALDFSSDDDDNPPHVLLPKILHQQQPFTVEMFVKAEKCRGLKHQMLFNLQGRPKLFVSGNDSLVWQVQHTPTSAESWNARTKMPFGRRFHVAAVSTGTEIRLFMDGQFVDKSEMTISNYLFYAEIGGNPQNQHASWGVLNGQIDQVRISKTARYDKGFTPPTRMTSESDTLVLYDFDEGQGDVLNDRSGNGHHAQILGAKWISLNRQAAVGPAPAGGAVPKPAIAPFDAAQARAHQEAWAKHLGVPVETTSPRGITLRLIPPGECPLGLPQSELETVIQRWKTIGIGQSGIDNIGWSIGRHTVRLTQPFYMAKFEFGRNEYLRLEQPTPIGNLPREPDDGPISPLTWLDAVAACNRLSTAEGLPPFYRIDGETVSAAGGVGYRLPTSAEWEYAFRAGTLTDYPWPVATTVDESSRDYAWYDTNSENMVQVRGQKLANPFGIHDMAGNVTEWCWDAAGKYSERVREGETVIDPQGPPRSPNRWRMLRGGHYQAKAETFPAWSTYAFEENRFAQSGFRVVRTIEPRPAAAVPATTMTATTPPAWTLRSMSEWAIQHGGQVLLGDGRTIARLEDLPAEVTRVDQITFTHVESFGDAEAAIVGSWPKLKGIAVGDTSITDAGLRKLAALPLGNILSVPATAITGAGFEAFAEKSLGTVVVCYCRLTPAGWKFLAGVGATNQWDCKHTNLTDVDLAEIVARHPEITKLDAQGTELTDASAEHLARLKNLRELFLQETGIADSGLEQLAPLKSLTSLTLQQTKVTAAGVSKLQQALPNCQIRWK
ncbi:MAG: SUMF1/EgtB/PvdO family nonheme iron enzyme [Planctomycetaceae bacterium]|nr:SUMF1/EgtB/PvdO family nonheme iron enzyme [Planctomycetaceae bacterium]